VVSYAKQPMPQQRGLGAHVHQEVTMIVLGIILLVVGFVAKIAIIWTIGIILVVAGALLALLGMAGREIGGRRHWY
jgi:uncharacterized membrane protein HdeD (DUF308 family)